VDTWTGYLQSSKGRRPGVEDVDAPSRLPLLNSPYYRDILSEYGAFFAIANRIDRIHKNAWIGFQSWRATARKVCGCSSYCFILGFVPLICFKVLFLKNKNKKFYYLSSSENDFKIFEYQLMSLTDLSF